MSYISFCGTIYKGSTQLLYFKAEVPLDDIVSLIITFQQLGKTIFEKNKNDIVLEELDDGTVALCLRLTQEETFLLSSKFPTEIQMRYKDNNNKVYSENISEFNVYEALNHEVI